jgi:hypothetical protein
VAAGQQKILSQSVEQRLARLDIGLTFPSVNPEADSL